MAKGDYTAPADSDVRAAYALVLLAIVGLVVLRHGFKSYAIG